MLYKNSTMEMFSEDGQWSHPCQVRINDEKIIVSYIEEGSHIVYEGEEKGIGHFLLKSESVNGSATLHCFSKSIFLEGWWKEDGRIGMWRITLSD